MLAPLSFSLSTPDDFHVHLRQDAMLPDLLTASARSFGRVCVMPNTRPPGTSASLVIAYHDSIKNLAQTLHIDTVMTLYLTEQTTVRDIEIAVHKRVRACKLYPKNATTHSGEGVKDIQQIYSVLGKMEELGMILLVHGEVTDENVDVFEREAVFIENYLKNIVQMFPKLKIVLEHVTTKEGVEFVLSAPETVAATITPQHLLYSRNALFKGGLRPHLYCLPILKAELHRQALIGALLSKNPKFFAGTDSAPHARENKEKDCGCAGCYTAPIAIELYAEAVEISLLAENKFSVEEMQSILQGFCSVFGAQFYGLPFNKGTIILKKIAHNIPLSYRVGDVEVVPLRAGEQLGWTAERSI